VGWFALWRRNRNLNAAIRKARTSQAPASIAAAIRKLISGGEYDKARLIARQAVESYPKSASIQDALRDLKKVRYAQEMKDLSEKIKQNPNPTLYARLAEMYYDLGETDQTLEVCRQCVANFPEYEGAYTIMGRLRHERFRKEGLARDGMKAVENYEKTIRLNPNSYKTLLELGGLYLEIGAIRLGVEKLEKIQEFDRTDERTNKLLDWARGQTPLPEEDLEDLFKIQQERRVQIRLETAADRIGMTAAQVERKVGRLEGIPGIISVGLVTPAGSPIVYRIHGEGLEEASFLEMLSSVFSAAQECSQRMDIGGVERGTITGEYVRVHFVAFETLALVVLTDVQSSKPEEVDLRVDAFIDEELYARGGAR